MRLVTFQGDDGQPGSARSSGDSVIDLAAASGGDAAVRDAGLHRGWPGGADRARELLAAEPSGSPPLSDVTLLAPIPRPRRNVFCLGLNYRAHAAEGRRAGRPAIELPEYPDVLHASPPTVDRAGRVIEIDTGDQPAARLGGRAGRRHRHRRARHPERRRHEPRLRLHRRQRRLGPRPPVPPRRPVLKGKSLDTFCPLGPWIVTADEIRDPGNLGVDPSQRRRRSRTRTRSELIFDMPTIIASLSEGMTLEAGDMILTGTPEGVGFARKPPEFLQDGDLVECEIEGIGVLRNPVRTATGRSAQSTQPQRSPAGAPQMSVRAAAAAPPC